MAAVRSENAAGWRSKRPSSAVPNTCDILIHGTTFCNRTYGPFLILGSGAGWRLPRRDTHNGIHKSQLSLVFFMQCAFQCSSRCVQNHYNRPTLVSRKNTPVLVFGCFSAPQRYVCRFTMHLCHLKQTLDKR